jgi:hypothetical protein
MPTGTTQSAWLFLSARKDAHGMRKRIITLTPSNTPDQEDWLSVEDIAQVEITSEDAEHPVESALLSGHREGWQGGWRAADAGVQTLRLLFDRPQPLRRIRLRFVETDVARTQEFVLRYSNDNGQSFHEIVRQQWNFSPAGSTHEVENYQVDLSDVTGLELIIVPDISGGNARASLAELRLA